MFLLSVVIKLDKAVNDVLESTTLQDLIDWHKMEVSVKNHADA